MDKQKLVKGVAFAVVAIGAFVLFSQPRQSGQVNNGDVSTPTQQGAAKVGDISFEKQVLIGEEVEIEYQMKKAGEAVPAKMTFKITQVGEVDEIGSTTPIAGQSFYFATYSIKGDSTNPTGADVEPQSLIELTAPQVVMLNENSMATIGGAVGGAYDVDFSKERGLEWNFNIGFNNDAWKGTAATWYTTTTENPIFAIQYNDLSGQRQFIRIVDKP